MENCRNILVLLGLGDAENAVYDLLQGMSGAGASTVDTENQINLILRAKNVHIDAKAILTMLRARGALDVYGTRVYLNTVSKSGRRMAVQPRVLKAEDLSEAV